MRLDGFFCEYQAEEKFKFLEKLNDKGVKNIEMESTCFASYTYRAGVKGLFPRHFEVTLHRGPCFCTRKTSSESLLLTAFYIEALPRLYGCRRAASPVPILSEQRLPAGIVCVALLNRMNGDSIEMTKEQSIEFEERPYRLVAALIRRQLHF